MFQNTKKLFLLVQWAVAKINKKWWMKNPEAVTRRFSQWCNLTLIKRFWATNVCLQAFGHPTGRATCWKAILKIIPYSLIQCINSYQYNTAWAILFNNTINRPKGCSSIKKETLTQIFSCEISRNNLFYRTHPGGCFWINFCKY